MEDAYRHFHSIMVEKAERFGDKQYVVSVDQDKQITFSQINHICNKVANFLREMGVQKDDKVTLIGKNSIETLIIFYGVLKLVDICRFIPSLYRALGQFELYAPRQNPLDKRWGI